MIFTSLWFPLYVKVTDSHGELFEIEVAMTINYIINEYQHYNEHEFHKNTIIR